MQSFGSDGRLRVTPWHTRIDLRADPQLLYLQCLHARTGRFSAGHHKLANAELDQSAGDGRERLLDHCTRPLHAEVLLNVANIAGRGRRVDEQGSRACMVAGPRDGSCNDVDATGNVLRVDV